MHCLMRTNGLPSAWKRKFADATCNKHDLPVAENVLNRQFVPEIVKGLAGIAYIRRPSGWL